MREPKKLFFGPSAEYRLPATHSPYLLIAICGLCRVLILLSIIVLDMPYPKIIVTGDSIAQLSFQAGGYGSMLCDIVSGIPLSRLSFTFSTMARLTS